MKNSPELKEIVKNISEIREIQQGYLFISDDLDLATRIRSNLNLKTNETKWFLTIKKKTETRIIEIETEIDSVDGFDLFLHCDKKVKKTRYLIKDNGLNFELDCFTTSETKDWYFVMVEIEVELNSMRPKLPIFLQKHLLYEVPLTDNRFSNTNLGDVNYTSKLYKELLEEN